jgi:uncharacterized membrane protein
MAQRTQLWWTFTFLSAGLGTIVTLISAGNLARRSVVTLVVLGAMLFSVSARGAGYVASFFGGRCAEGQTGPGYWSYI